MTIDDDYDRFRQNETVIVIVISHSQTTIDYVESKI